MRAVSNSGPIIHLSWIDQLNLLPQLFNEILVPMAVREEILRASPDVPGVSAICTALEVGWLAVRVVADPSAAAQLRAELDEGEAEAIALMEELGADVLLLDDRRARAQAVARGMPISRQFKSVPCHFSSQLGRKPGSLLSVPGSGD
jgi:predicted nucleic acid-binding protein